MKGKISLRIELFRWSNKDVMIITFDELLEKIETLLTVFKKEE